MSRLVCQVHNCRDSPELHCRLSIRIPRPDCAGKGCAKRRLLASAEIRGAGARWRDRTRIPGPLRRSEGAARGPRRPACRPSPVAAWSGASWRDRVGCHADWVIGSRLSRQARARHPAHAHPPLVWSREGEIIANPSPAGSYGVHRLGTARGSSPGAGSSPASQAKPSRTGNRPAGRDVSRRKRRQPKRINKFLTFRKIAVNDLVSRKMVHSAMVASFRQSDGHENADGRRPPDCDPGARAPIAIRRCVIPANAGIQSTARTESLSGLRSRSWMPAYAGMTRLAVTKGAGATL